MAVEPDNVVKGVIWVQSKPKEGVVDDVRVFVYQDEDGMHQLSLFSRLLSASSSPDLGLHALEYRFYCDSLAELILSWKLGLYPSDFSEVASPKRRPFPSYEYTTKAKLPWSPTEELSLTLHSRSLDRQLEFAQGQLRRLLERQRTPLRLPGSPEGGSGGSSGGEETPEEETDDDEEVIYALLRSDDELETKAKPSGSATEEQQKEDQQQQQQQQQQEQEDQQQEQGDQQQQQQEESPSSLSLVSEQQQKGLSPEETDKQRDNPDALPWYRTLTGVTSMLLGMGVFMLFCFRCCMKRRGNDNSRGGPLGAPGAPSEGEVQLQTLHKDANERRTAECLKGYSHISDQHAIRDPETGSWWEEEDVRTFTEA
ncbi:acetyltransferase domain-containing protein, putative [Eimeria acervulina]|uniref:Acetyltransferase domain-containing protein, putative n=1 Tax=Eimeria acervulina TaxID=5801 RepID=U6GCY6_EIMAC|nr:acetyltransferase domain-containing protein, putative [Eimeria acervulina]CDI77193.1 acetyltransferase domain-containing protein, putative [Eimeria acervulina]